MDDALDTQPMPLCELILYACPSGELTARLDRYFAVTLATCGANAAHRYMPHITLTGFFHDEAGAVPFYVRQVAVALTAALAIKPEPPIRLTRIDFEGNFHRIEAESPWLEQLTRDFIVHAERERRREAIRKKDQLHLSLAYDFPVTQHATLRTLAERIIRLDAPAGWELRFYERHPDTLWTCHGAWSL